MPTSKPTNLDAQRVIAILDELKEKLTFLSLVSSQVLDGLQGEDGQQACEQLGTDLVNQIANQIRLEETYLRESAAGEGAFGNQEDNDELREDVKQLQKNTLELCRKMKLVPNIVPLLREFQESGPGMVMQFLKTLNEMQTLTLKRLTTTVEEEKSRQDLLEYYRTREREASSNQRQLETDLAHIREDARSAKNESGQVLNKLRADLQDVRVTKQDQMNSLRNRFETRMKDHTEAFENKQQDLVKRINALKESNAALRRKSEDEENSKKKQANRYDTDVKTVINEYDEKVIEINSTINEKSEHAKKEQRQLDELQEHFAKVDAEDAYIQNEMMIERARRQKLNEAKRNKDDQAALVQAFWRAIIEREKYQVMKKKKGGAKKGKGKKK